VATLVEYPTSMNLRRLLWVRCALFTALTVLIAVVARIAGYTFPLRPLAAIVAMLGAITLLGWLRLTRSKRPIRNVEILFQLGIDIAALTGVLYFTGGWTNPLVSLYLVPIAAAVAMLPARFAWAIAIVTVLCYALTAAFYQPLVSQGDSFAGPFTLHVLGMWLTFVIAAGLIAYFGTTMAATLRSRAAALAAAREEILRNEQIIGVATLAAGTAHELSTPLGSIALIAGELQSDAPHLRREIAVMLTQIEVCKDILRRLRDTANPRATPRDPVNRVDRFVADVRERFELLRPAAAVHFAVTGDASGRFIAADETLRQAVLNLLNNAADVSPQAVDCSAHCASDHLVLDILDRGAGFNVATGGEAAGRASTASANGSSEGMGMGLLLANATIERLGGSVRIADRDGGGAWVRVTLPLRAGAA
jgi:two-component system, sensor histidine kinase RegB